MRWHMTYTVKMGKHGNQRISIPIECSEDEIHSFIDDVSDRPDHMILDVTGKRAFPVKDILLIEWSESK